MCSQSIDPDCLRAVLSRLPLAELIRNVSLQLVSRQFSECQRLGLKTRASRSSVCLQINRQNYHPSNAKNRLLSVGGVVVSTSNLVQFNASYLLDFISEVCFKERWHHSLAEDLAIQLQDILERLRAVDKLTLKLPDGYDERYHRTKDQKQPQFYAFKALLTADLSFLPALASLELSSCVASPAFYIDIAYDFLQLLRLASSLSALALPTQLFVHVVNYASGTSLLSRLVKLDLREVCDADDELTGVSCQPIVIAVAENCNSLAEFGYDCSVFGSGYSRGGKHVCIHDFTVLQRLTSLRCLKLHLAAQPCRKRSAATSDEISVLPIATLESLTVVGQPFYSAEQTLALIDMAANAKQLHLTDSDANQGMTSRSSAFYESLRDRLVAKRLPRLEALHLNVFNDRPGSLRSLDIITAIEAPIALRSVRLEQIYDDPYEVHHSRDRLDSILNAITQAVHITHLRTRFFWQDGYLVLERLLRAMQHGSLQLLTLDVRWHYEQDQRLFNAVMPSGCEITEWNVFDKNKFPDSVVIRGTKITAAAGNDVTPHSFVVRLQNELF